MTAPDIVARRVGRERQPVVIVDGFAPDPDALRAAAISAAFGPADRHYPGIRAPLRADYLASAGPLIATIFAEVFGCERSARVLDAALSIVTTPPARLSLAQRLPHVDAVEPGRLAMVHYLAPHDTSGTGFYRHRATGFETIDAERAPTYFAAVERELRAHGEPRGYVGGDNALFERIGIVDARYNRALFYRSGLLHSGAIAPDAPLSADPAVGRLTVTAFFDAA